MTGVESAARQLILASSSRHRRMLLDRLRLPYRCAVPDIDESRRPGEDPESLVARLSLAKAVAGGAGFTNGLIIGSDQVALLDDTLLGKPGTREKAIDQLVRASGRSMRFLTGCVLLDQAAGTHQSAVVATDVEFRHFTRAEIETYVDIEQPYDCAGSFKGESLGIVLFERIVSSDPSALTGLPLIALTAQLNKAGMSPLHQLHR